MPTVQSRPKLSIIAVFYNMAREAPRTLYSFSTDYQQDVDARDYEVLVVDNGSNTPLTEQVFTDLSGQFRLINIADAPPSPAHAINRGVDAARGEQIGILIDGARMASPGMLRQALDALQAYPAAMVSTIGFHLGPDMQTRSPAKGYNQQVEDELLEKIQWKQHGYRLFQNSALAGSSKNGWFGSLAESNLFFMSKQNFQQLEGYDEGFDLPGGGFVNLDFYKRACEQSHWPLVTLLGEATFHQIHGGIMTNRPEAQLAEELAKYREQYRSLRGEEFAPSRRRPLLLGHARPEVQPWLSPQATPAKSSKSEHDHDRPKYSLEQVANARKQARGKRVIQQADTAPQQQDHRSYVGPDDYYDKVAALQFGLLSMLGMRETDRLLDIGCGSLRGGRLFLPYLNAGGYHAVEPNPWLIENAVEKEIGADLIRIKTPRFEHNDQFDFSAFNTSFDYMMAHSIFSHTSLMQFDQCLASVADHLDEQGVLAATFVEAHKDRYKDEWEYPGFNHFCWPTIQGLLSRHGLCGAKLDWPHPLQTWFAVAKNPQRLQQIVTDGVDLLADDLVLTGHRFIERGEGRFLSFYRHWKAQAGPE